jgi:hypothetical protein
VTPRGDDLPRDLFAEDVAAGDLLPVHKPIPYQLTDQAIAAIRRNHARTLRRACRSLIPYVGRNTR